MTQLVYAGIGSRATPGAVLENMTVIATWLARRGWHLNTGGAIGADTAFAAGAPGRRTLFLLLYRRLFDDGFPGLFRASEAWISHIVRALPDR